MLLGTPTTPAPSTPKDMLNNNNSSSNGNNEIFIANEISILIVVSLRHASVAVEQCHVTDTQTRCANTEIAKVHCRTRQGSI